MKIANSSDIFNAEANLREAINSYLTNRGWVWTYGTPGCIWLWKKKIGESIFIVNESTALFTERLDDV